MNRIVIHYSEIALKGKNRRQFEDALIRHVRAALGPLVSEVRKQQGRLVCKPNPQADPQRVREILSTCWQGRSLRRSASRPSAPTSSFR